MPDVVAYYEATRLDFAWLWTGATDQAVHFGYYDEGARRHGPALLAMNALLAQAAAIHEDDHVLDAGCGLGGSAMWLAQHHGCTVRGITLVPFQARKGMQELQRRGLRHKATLLLADYGRTPFPDGSFSVVWALESFVHCADRAAVLAEAHRLLVPGGRLVATDCIAREEPPLAAEERAELEPGLAGWAMAPMLTASAYRRAITQAGFELQNWRDISTHIAPSVRRLGRMCALAQPGARVLAGLGAFSPRRLQNLEGSLRQSRAFERGLWRYVMYCAQRPLGAGNAD